MKKTESPIFDNFILKTEDQVAVDPYPFSDAQYICQSTTLITQSMQKGFDVAQLPNGDITITEIQLVSVHYRWDHINQQFIKGRQH